MDVDTVISLIESSSNRKLGTNDGGPTNFFFSDSNTWNNRVFTPQCLSEATEKLEKSINELLNSLVELCDDYRPQNVEPTESEEFLAADLRAKEAYQSALDDLWIIRSAFREVESLKEIGEISNALTSLHMVSAKLKKFGSDHPGSQLHAVLVNKADDLSSELRALIKESWEKMVDIKKGSSGYSLTVLSEVGPLMLDQVHEALMQITPKGPNSASEKLLSAMETMIFDPILALQASDVSISGNELTVSINKEANLSVEKLLCMIREVIDYLNTRFDGTALKTEISNRFSSLVTRQLCGTSLPRLFPPEPTEVPAFQEELRKLIDFQDYVQRSARWNKICGLEAFIDDFPNEWLRCRRANYLDLLRTELLSGFDTRRIVDPQANFQDQQPRHTAALQEPQPSHNDGKNDVSKDWNTAWSDDDNNDGMANAHTGEEDDGVDADAWGVDTDDWGWDEEEQGNALSANAHSKEGRQPKEAVARNGQNNNFSAAQMCTVTTQLDKLLSIIEQYAEGVEDRRSFSKQLSDFLALYRALSPLAYKVIFSPVVIYNDVSVFIDRATRHENGALRYVSDADCTQMVDFARTNLEEYVESRRSLLSEQLLRANGFANCNPDQDLLTCQSVVDQCVHLISEFYSETLHNASFAITCRLVGTLVEYLVTSMMTGIESQSDISAVECDELSKLIEGVSSLARLFLPDSEGGEETSVAAAAALNAPSWIKFQYFGEILKSNLVDIMSNFNDGLLGDFSATELIGLIRALFAESEHRHRAINDILRASK
ncbi:hypothetical protein TRVA0_004S04544 [Trichomonascus vanleenenianus]|uniref:Dsl1p n=1 Tax=Trichomonascus vanleenenianus TaxID=2268995 RepID=UPI003ECB1AC7